MKKYLIWSRFPFMTAVSRYRILRDDLIQSNSGNLAFHTSVVRTLMTEGTTFRSIFPIPGKTISKAQIEEYNSYDALILPLANAFRDDYIPFLRMLTELIEQLKIPCIVTSVGIQFSNQQGPETQCPFDEDVYRFASAVLNHSGKLGLRGELTGEYLKRLGFAEGSHYEITGCPSMYYLGRHFPKTRAVQLDSNSKVYIYSKVDASDKIHALMERSCNALPNYTYVAQLSSELKYMAYGVPNSRLQRKNLPNYYPLNREGEAYGRRVAVGFTDFPMWIEAMHGADACYGCNIHGTVPSLLAGTPAVVIARDRRVAEIADFYDIPIVQADEADTMRSIVDAFEKADYTAMYSNYTRHFENYLHFLEANGLEHVYSADPEIRETPWDRYYASITHAKPIQYEGSIGPIEQLQGIFLRANNRITKAKIKHK